MPKNILLKIFFLVAVLFAKSSAFAQDFLEKNLWYNQEKTAKIKIYKSTDGRFYGRIVWLKEPYRNGRPKIDYKNPDKAKQNDPIVGLVILKGFKKDGEEGYDDGTIYDPNNGKTYSCKMTRVGDALHVRGYIGFSMIGRTTTWTKAD